MNFRIISMTDETDLAVQPQPNDNLVEVAARMLSDVFAHPIQFKHVERLTEPERRNQLLRCHSAPTPNTPSSFIIKKVETDSHAPLDPDSHDSQRFFGDWVGSQFLSGLAGGTNHSPRFYAANRALGFIILEDLGPHRSLVEPLLHEDAHSARKALLRYSVCLGKLHADTTDKFAAFERLYHQVNPGGKSLSSNRTEFEHSTRQVQSSLQSLGILTEAPLLRELAAIVSAAAAPGPFLAYIHADPCPDNVFDTAEQMRLIDFELGHYGHALIDAAYGRMIFPSCWCANRLPAALVPEMEARYRAELIHGCPAAQDDNVFEQALVTICGYWLVNTLAWHLERALEEDDTWGIASTRQRIIARLEAFIATSQGFGRFPALRDAAGRLHALLFKRWPDSPPLPLYPAFREPQPEG